MIVPDERLERFLAVRICISGSLLILLHLRLQLSLEQSQLGVWREALLIVRFWVNRWVNG